MTKKDKIFLAVGAVIVLLLILVACVMTFSGSGKAPGQTEQTAGTQVAPGEYTVQLLTDSDQPLEGVGIYVYTDETQAELVWFARTDAEGRITFRDITCEGYIAILDGISDDYIVEEFYPLAGEVTTIVVEAQMQSGVDLNEITRSLGDVMFDFTVTSTGGVEYTLSELLKEKEAVVLNFWYVECQPCRAEFPYLQEAYEQYSDRIEVLAMNPVNGDEEKIAAFKKELELTFPMFAVDPAWEHAMQLTAYPTTVIIDRYGVISLIHKGSVTSTKVFTDAFEHFVGDDYEQGVVENIEDLETEAPGSDPGEPIELGGVQSFQVTVPAGGKIYYHLYRVNGYLSTQNSVIYAECNGSTYGPKSGGIGFYVKSPDTYTPVKVAFGNDSNEAQTFTVYIAAPQGTFDNPYSVKLGEFSTTVAAGNDQGVYYQYRATEEGYLTIECLEVTAGVKYDYVLYNTSSTRMNTMREDGNDECTMVSVKVKPGDVIKITVATLPDSSNTYPRGVFKSKLFMSDTPVTEETEQAAKIDYAVTVTDENRKPLSGVYLNVTVGEKPVPIVTDEKGVAHTKQVAGTYPVVLTLPAGYTAATTEFELTENRPYASLKLDTLVVEKAEYTVTVVDEAGNPVPGITVVIGVGNDPLTTDENGKVTITLPKAAYTVTVSQPDGTLQNQTFAEGETEMTVVLGQGGGSGEDENKITYTVKVVDYSGNAQSGIMVQILKDGTPVAVKTTDVSGQITADLAVGDYTVALAVSGMYYEQSDAVLSSGRPYVVLRVTDVTGGEPVDEWFGPTYTVGEGGTYVQMQSNVVTYFAFTPEREGLYRITASHPDAIISYWGSINFPIQQEINGGVPTNTFEVNVKESNLGATYAIGVTGVSECILEIERIGPAELDNTDVPWEVYEGNPPTAVYSAGSGKTFTYVDLTGKTSDFKPVLGSDGYYHLNSASGKLLYVNLGPNAPYISMYNMLGFTGFGGTRFGQYFYDADGNLLKKEDYTDCMSTYVECIDPQYGVYPLTEDLIYMLKNGGENQHWWDSADENNFLFAELGDSFNEELGWMFAVCYEK